MSTPYSQLIHRYLDGELSTDLERSLFDELAGNEELRREFGVELELHKAATADMASIVPPDNIRASVFSRLDIPTTSEEPEIITATSASSRFLTFGTVALCSMILGGAAVWFGLNYNNHTYEQVLLPKANHEQNQDYRQSALTSPSPSAGSIASVTQPDAVSLYKNTHQNSSLYRLSKNSPFDNSSNSSLSSSSSYSLFDEIKRQVAAIASNESSIQHDQNAIAVQVSPSIYNSDRFYSNVSQINTNGTLSSANEEQQPGVPFYIQMQGVNNLADANSSGKNGSAYTIAAMYELDADNSLGIEVCNDYFGRKETYRINGMDSLKTQNERVIAIGAAYHLSLPAVSYGQLATFVQSFAGATINGLPIARTALGVEWTPDSRVTISGGIGASAIGYRANGVWKSSSTLGLVYGVSVLL